jgi:peptide/nickel transport system substrate-binding protein
MYKGSAVRLTGDQNSSGAAYDRSIEPLPFDPKLAKELLTEAGWYDRDGDGVVDRDGAALDIEFLYPAGNQVSQTFGEMYQENLARVGVRMEIATRDMAACMQRIHERDFDAVNLAWVLPPENDPEQLWHSRWADKQSSNVAGLADSEVDRLINAIQVELDAAKRAGLFHQLQHRLFELQPYMFGVGVPRRFAMSKRIRNFQIFAIDPCYSIRRWYLADKDAR